MLHTATYAKKNQAWPPKTVDLITGGANNQKAAVEMEKAHIRIKV